MICWKHTKELIEVALQCVTIIVLGVTWWAVRRQARAAEKLIQATEQQIETGQEQAKAAKEQVEVARRQITEALRPILTSRVMQTVQTATGSLLDIEVQNNGAGTALDVWWSYGDYGAHHMTLQRHRIQSGIIPPTRGASFRVEEARVVHEGIVIAYESLAGISSASTLKWEGNAWVPAYIPDASEWTRSLLGKLIGPT